jgi:hypothetical protein
MRKRNALVVRIASLLAVFSFGVGLSLLSRPESVSADGEGIPHGVTMTFFRDPYSSRGWAWDTSSAISGSDVELAETDEMPEGLPIDWSSPSIIHASGSFMKIDSTDSGSYNSHKAHAETLKPGRTYCYRLGSLNDDAWSEPAFFSTGMPGSDVSFIHVTDPQAETAADYEVWADNIEKAAKAFPQTAFAVCTGDFVNNSRDDDPPTRRMNEWNWCFDLPQSYFRSEVIVPAAGNHEEGIGVFANRFDISAPNGCDPSRGMYYSFDYGPAHFTVLNTNDPGLQSSDPMSEAQISWIENDLAAARAPWKIVALHKGLISPGLHNADADVITLRRQLLPLMAEYGVDLVLQGHDHIYFRSQPYAYGRQENGAFYDGRTIKSDLRQTYALENGVEVPCYVNPNGTIYSTINAFGTKFFDMTSYDASLIKPALNPFDGQTDYRQPRLDMLDRVSINGNRLSLNVYEMRQDGSLALFDKCDILKTGPSYVDAAFVALPSPIDMTWQNLLAAKQANDQYEGLSLEQKVQVSPAAVAKRDAIEAFYGFENIDEALPVAQLIASIGNVTESKNVLLRQIESLYEGLTAAARRCVVNYGDYVAALAKLDDLNAASLAEMAIDAILKAANASDKAARIAAARAEYDALTEAQKGYVMNYQILLAAEGGLI